MVKPKKAAAVIGIKKHKSIVHELDLQLEHKASIIEDLQVQLVIEQQANESVRLELKLVQESFIQCKIYWETNTKVMHDELHKYSEHVSEYKITATEAQNLSKQYKELLLETQSRLETENRLLKLTQRKWYHFF